MCLYYDKEATKKLRAKMKARGGTMTLWKVYSHYAGWLWPIYWSHTGSVGPGVVKSDRQGTVRGGDDKDSVTGVLRGIHVYTTRGRAKGNQDRGEVIVPVTCRLSDLVAAGNAGDAVFMKVEITRRNYKRAVAG